MPVVISICTVGVYTTRKLLMSGTMMKAVIAPRML